MEQEQPRHWRYTAAAGLLIFLAVFKTLADLSGQTELSALAAVTNASPAMKVFTAQKGYETYSSTFELQLEYQDGTQQSQFLRPDNYAGLQGPYNRRNVYGALIAYGPVLVSNSATQAMWQKMAKNAFCATTDNVTSELGFKNSTPIRAANISYHGQVTSDALPYPNQLRISCE